MTKTSPRPESAERHALRAGLTIEEVFNLTKINRWFLVQIRELVDFEEEMARLTAKRQLLAQPEECV